MSEDLGTSATPTGLAGPDGDRSPAVSALSGSIPSAEPEHGYCPNCSANLDGGLVWQTGLEMARSGALFVQRGQPAPSEADAERLADDYAASYGATRTRGHWGRATRLKYLSDGDNPRRRDDYRCPDCKHEWPC